MSRKKLIKETVKNNLFQILQEDEGYQTYNSSIENGEPDYEAIKKAAVDGTPNIKQSVEAALNDDKENFDRAALNMDPYSNSDIKNHEPLENLIIMCGLASEDLDNERVDTILDGLYQVIQNFADDLQQVIKNTNKEDDENKNIRQVEKEKQEMYENQNVEEHHKYNRADKEEFIHQNFKKVFGKELNPTNGNEEKDLSDMSDETIDWLYDEIEDELGLKEQPNSTNVAPLNKMNEPEGTNQTTNLDEIRDDDTHEKEVYHSIDYDINLYKNEDDNIYKIDAKTYSGTKFQDIYEAMNALLSIMEKNNDINDIINNIEPNKTNIIEFNGTEFNMDEFNNFQNKSIEEINDENTWGNDERMWQETYRNSYEDKEEKTQADRLYGGNKSGYKKQKTGKMEQRKLTEVKKEKNQHKNLKEIFNLIGELNTITEVSDTLMEDSKEDAYKTFYNDAKSKISELNNKLNKLKEQKSEQETNDATAYNMANVPAQRYLNQVQDYNEKYENEYMDERMSHIENSQKTEQDEAYEEKKRQLEDEDNEYVETTRGRDTLDFDYDSEPPEEYKDRVKREVETGRSEEKTQEELDSEANVGGDDPYGDDGTRSDVGKDKYDTAQKRREIDNNKPMYNKDEQPVEDEEDYEEDKKEQNNSGTALKEFHDRFYNILNYQGNKPNSKSKRDNVNEDFKNSYRETKLLFKNHNKVAINEVQKNSEDKKVEINENGPIIKINDRIVSKGFNANHVLGKAEALCESYNNEIDRKQAIAYIMTKGNIID